jgi:hypothetical protein
MRSDWTYTTQGPQNIDPSENINEMVNVGWRLDSVRATVWGAARNAHSK